MPVVMKIVGVEAPSSASPGSRVEVKVTAKNIGDAGPGYVYIYDLDTGEEMGGVGYGTVEPGTVVPCIVSFTMPNRTVRLKAITGEGLPHDRKTQTDSTTITISVTAPPPTPSQPKFDIVSVPTNITAQPGETVNIPVKVKNTGNASGTCLLQLRSLATNAVVASKTVTLSPNQDTTITFSLPGLEEGTYKFRVEAWNENTGKLDEYVNITVTVTGPPKEPHFTITWIVPKVSVAEGYNAQIRVKVKNDGNSDGYAWISLYNERGEREDYYSNVYFKVGEEREFTLYTRTRPAGTYTYKVKVWNVNTGKYDDEATVTVEILVNQPRFDILSVEPTSIMVEAGKDFGLTVKVQNKGGKTGSCRIDVVDEAGNIRGREQIYNLMPLSTATILVTVKGWSEPGLHTLTVKAVDPETGEEHDKWTDIKVEVYSAFDVKSASIKPAKSEVQIDPTTGKATVDFYGEAFFTKSAPADGVLLANIEVNGKVPDNLKGIQVGAYKAGDTGAPIKFTLEFTEPGTYTIRAYIYTSPATTPTPTPTPAPPEKTTPITPPVETITYF